jgi:hypothetical protein
MPSDRKLPCIDLLRGGRFTDALITVVDREHSDPRYLLRLVCLLNHSTAAQKKMLAFLSQGPGHNEAALLACWELDCDCRPYAVALEEYIFDTFWSYPAVKQWFEQRVFKVMELGGKCYVYVKDDQEVQQHSQGDISSLYSNLFFAEQLGEVGVREGEGEDEEAGSQFKGKQFVPVWFKDPSMRTFKKLVCNASRTKQTPEDEYNVWPGILAETLPPVLDGEVALLIEPVIQHIRLVVARGVEAHAEWFIAWLAHMVQTPDIKTAVAVILTGAPGVGKNTIFDFFRDKVLGYSIAKQYDSAAQVLEKHSTALDGTLFLQLDEAEGQVCC